jgi:Acyl-CoA reductase (LuxC)
VTRNALTRSDALIKTPSNDPLTAIALARTMIEMDSDHPVTRHLSVMHWLGGDERIEMQVFSSTSIDKIVAWGGAGAIENAARYVGPGVELVALDPKRSMSLLGARALDGDAGTREAAYLLSRDLGLYNQVGCVNARVAYVETEGVTDPQRQLRLLGQAVYESLQTLPLDYSAPVDRLDPRLSKELETASFMGEPEVIGKADGRGGVILSEESKPVDFSEILSGRYLNLVPVVDFSAVLASVTSTDQTVGVWPPMLKEEIAHTLALAGVQRIVSLGGATNPYGNQTIPQDGIEVLRRMCRWIINEDESEELLAALKAAQ